MQLTYCNIFREPYMIMENNNAFKHRKIALVTIAEAMTRQWFGYVLYPDNWRHQWVLTGLNNYVAYDIVNEVSNSESIKIVAIMYFEINITIVSFKIEIY